MGVVGGVGDIALEHSELQSWRSTVIPDYEENCPPAIFRHCWYRKS
jgi:hypothetical protein